RSIVNAHFKAVPPPGLPPMLGVIGGLVQWIFPFEDRISITVSGADAIVDDDRESLARRFWADVAKVLHLPADLPPWQVVKERRATFAATPAQAARRPPARTRWVNLLLAGDWTATGLPATIEGTIAVDKMLGDATAALLKSQRADGHWVFELEADATIPSEYVLLVHYLAETPNLELERKIGNYLRRIQSAEHGG